MIGRIFVLSFVALAAAVPLTQQRVPAVSTQILLDLENGAKLEHSFSDSAPGASASIPENDVTPLWSASEPVAIYSSVSLGSKNDAAFSTWLSAPKEAVVSASDDKPIFTHSASSNAAQTEVLSSPAGDLTVTAEYVSEGYNMSGTIRVLSNAGAKMVWEKEIGGAGAGYGSIAMGHDGVHFAVVANVNSSYVIPGHARVMCFSSASSTPYASIDLDAGEFASQAATTMSDDQQVAFAAGTKIYVADCKTSKLVWSYDRQYVATSLAFSADGKYVATSFTSVQVFEKKGQTYEMMINAPLASPDAPSTPFIGASLAISRSGKLAVGAYNGVTARQNRLDVYDLATKNVSFSYTYKNVDFQPFQDNPVSLSFTDNGKQIAVGSWGDQNHTNPQVHLFCLVCGKLLMTYTTPGSVFSVSAASTDKGIRVLAGGKHVHANTYGSGGDLFMLEYVFTEAQVDCRGEARDAMAKSDSQPVVDEDMIRRLNSQNGMSWTAGVNTRFEGVTVGQAKQMMGTILDTEVMQAVGVPTTRRVFESENKDTPIPKSFSVATAFPGCEAAIKDQAQCGSCWAFASSETLSVRSCVAQRAAGRTNATNVPLSPEELVSCDKRDYGCGGGFLYFAWEFLEESGLVTETCFPYAAGSGSAPACRSTCADSESFTAVKVKQGSLQYYLTVEEIQRALMARGAVNVAFNVYSDFMQYKDGVYQRTPTAGFMGGHAVMITGWGTDSVSGLDYWEVQNSWGVNWGKEGKFWIRRGVNECGIEYNSIIGEPIV